MELNKDIEGRDKLIFGRYRPNRYKFGNVCKFEGVDLDTMDRLLEQNYIFFDDICADDIMFEDIYDFVQKYPDYKIHGYTTLEHGIKVQGVEKGTPNDTVEEFTDYMALFRDCKHFGSGTMYCSFE